MDQSRAQSRGLASWVSRTVRDIWNQAFGQSESRTAPVVCQPALGVEPLERRVLLTAFVVDTNLDNVAADGDVSLREAVQAASTNAAVGDAPAGDANGDTIEFNIPDDDAGTGQDTIELTLGELSVTDDLEIDGDNQANGDMTIDAANGSRVFNINTSETVTLDNGLTMTNGFSVANGGAIIFAGGGTLNVTGSTVSNSAAGGAGGGIYVDSGTLVVNATSVTGNDATTTGGAIHTEGTTTVQNGSSISGNDAGTDGGGIYTASPLTVDNATIASNTASGTGATNGGGGIFNAGGGVVNLNNSANVTNNTADGTLGSGGGILNMGTLNVDASGINISGNDAERAGGGIEHNSASTLTLDNVTLNNNDALGTDATAPGNGGALHITGSADSNITGATVIGNTAAEEGGGLWNGTGTMTVDASSVTGNTASTTGGGIHNEGTLDILNGSSISGNNAGTDGGGIYNESTLTVDNVTVASNTASGAGATNGGGGIFNSGGATLNLNNSANVTNNIADGTLGSGGGILNMGTLNVDASGINISGNDAERAGGGIEHNTTNTLTLDSVILDNNDALGADATAPGNGGGLHVTGSADVNITDGTVNGNTAAEEGGGLWNGTGTMTISGTTIDGNVASGDVADQGGGGIFNAGGAVVTDATVTISNNDADGASGSGGGIFNDTGGTLDINGSTISGNEANRAGGGIEENSGYYPYSAFNSFSVQLDDVTISGNTAGAPGTPNPGNGGGVHITGSSSVDIQGGSTMIENNVAAAEGGGLWNSSNGGLRLQGGITVQGNEAQGNAADQGGGGIFTDGGTVIITGTALIQNNDATGTSGSGGGIFSAGGGTDANGNPAVFNVLGATIQSNTAVRAGGGVEIVDGTFNITDSTIDGNGVATTPTAGGGLHITGSGEVDMNGVTISNNEAEEGGGVWVSSTGTFTDVNNTISTNVATVGEGGGIFNDDGTVDLHSTTVTENTASTGGSGGIAGGSGGVNIQNTIVAQNTVGGSEANLSGTIASDDHNVIGDPDDGTVTGDTAHNIYNANALLGPLQNNGGFTDTHLPSAGSPAIDNGDALQTDTATPLADDQRGTTRPQGARDDIGSVEVQLNAVNVAGPPADGSPDEFVLTMDDNGTPNDVSDDQVLVSINGAAPSSIPANNTGQITITGTTDDDTLVLDNSNGLIRPDIIFNGGLGFDALQLMGTTPVTTTYNPGQTPDAGAVYQENNQVVQQVQFTGLEPVQVQGAGPGDTLVVAGQPLGAGFPQALNDDNQINYAEGPNSNQPLDPFFAGDTTGLVTVDGFESLEFSNFGTLQIDAGAGSDEINLNNPETPDDLADITVNAGDPTGGSDTVVVNGTTAADTITIDQLTNDGAVVTGAQPVTVTVDEAEELLIEGQGGNDSLTYTSSGADIVLQPGDVADAASIAADGFGTGGLLPVSYAGLGNGGSLTFTPTGGRNDGIDIHGNGDDNQFDVDAAGTVQVSKVGFGIAQTLPISADSATFLRLIGEDGDDVFNVAGDHPFTSGVEVQGGNPGGSDVLNFTGSGAGLVTLDLDAKTVTETGFTLVSYSGTESVNIDAASAGVTVAGSSAADEDFTYTPTDTDDGTIEVAGTDAVFNLSNVDPAALTVDGNDGDDTLTVRGTTAGETIGVDVDSIDVGGLLPAQYEDLEALTVEADEGDDSIVVDIAGTDLIGEALTVDGGAGSDSLTVSGTPSVTVNDVTYDPGPTADAGQLSYDSTGTDMAISFTGLEPVIDLVPAATLTVNGTGADNAISYSQVGANGLVSVDGFETIEFANKTTLAVNGVSGTDTLTVNGDAGTTDDLTVTPTGQDAGTVSTGSITDVDYAGVENLSLVGQIGDGDTFSVEGTTDGDLFEYLSGLTPDTGMVEGIMDDAAFTLPTVEFSGMNPGATRSFNTGASGGQDDLLFRGTFSDDEISYDGAGVLSNAIDGTPIAIVQVGTAAVGGSTTGIVIEGDDGDDEIEVTPEDGVTIFVRGGNSSPGSDTLIYNAAGATEIQLSDQDIEDSGSGGLQDASFSGIEVLEVDAGGSDLTVTGTSGDDTISVLPLGADTGSIEAGSSAPLIEYENASGALTIGGGSAGDDVLEVLGDTGSNTGTSGASTVTFNGGTVTVGSGIDQLNVLGMGGSDDIDMSSFTMSVGVQIFGGPGNDTIVGTPNNDFIDGGAGNDDIEGGDGDDQIFGGAGADVIEGQGGDDNLFGDADADLFIWNNGDGSDDIEGGGSRDVQVVNGAAAGDDFEVRDVAGRVEVERTNLGTFTLDMGGVERVDLNTGDGADTVDVGVLDGTDLEDLMLDTGAGDDTIVLADGASLGNGTGTLDGGADADTLDYSAYSTDVVVDLMAGTATGTTGVSGIEEVIGGSGDDMLAGSAGDDILTGGAGDDTFVGNGGTDTVDGGSGGDTILVEGTPGDDVLSTAVVGGELVVNGTDTYTLTGGDLPGVERVLIDAGDGDDDITVVPLSGIQTTIVGGAPNGQLQNGSDVLDIIMDGAFGHQRGPTPDSGTIDPPAGDDVSYEGVELLQVNGESIVLADRFEGDDVIASNDTQAEATVLGSEHKITLRDLTLHSNVGVPGGTDTTDEDYFQITAQDTGKLVINAFFSDAAGNLDLEILDADGDQVVLADSTTDDELIAIPVVGQQQYFLHAFSPDSDPLVYDLEIENFQAPVAHIPELPAVDQNGDLNDTGMSQTDDITMRTEPEIIIEADLDEFAAEGIDILDNAEITAGEPGAAVQVYVNGIAIGFADPVAGTGNTKFRYTFTPGQLPVGTFAHSSGGWLHNVKAAVRMFDGQDPQQSARSPLSEPLELVTDTVAPTFADTFTVGLAGVHEVPSVDSTDFGEATLTLNAAQDRLEMFIQLDGLDLDGTQTADPNDDVVGLHIHNGDADENGPVVFGMIAPNNDTNADLTIDAAAGTVFSGWDLAEGNGTTLGAQLADLLDGGLYLNVHTPANPGGEIRGQILPDPHMLRASDSGEFDVDGVTNINQPAFIGTGEANAKVRVFANGELVGQGVVGSDLTDGVAGNGLGQWEITVEPLTDGDYVIAAETEDLAGNISEYSDIQQITIDTTMPQRPTIDLLNEDDTGISNTDNITIGDWETIGGTTYWTLADFRISAEEDSEVVVKDGETVIPVFIGGRDTAPVTSFTFDSSFDMTDGVADGFGVVTVDFRHVESTEGIPGQGPHPLSAEATDLAGNMKQSEEERVEITSTELALIDFHEYVDETVISIYDTNPENGVSDPSIAWMACEFTDCADIMIDHVDGANVTNSIVLADGKGSMEDIGITVEDNLWLGSVVDTRSGDPAPLGFLVSEGQVGYGSIRGGLAGGDINGLTTEGLWKLPDDPDRDGETTPEGDLTGWYTEATSFHLDVHGEIAGDVVSDDGQLWKVKSFGDDISGDVWAGGNIGWVQALGGSVSGDVTAGCRLFDVLALGGDVSGDVSGEWSIGSVLAIEVDGEGGDVSSPGPTIWSGGRIDQILAIGGGVTANHIEAASIGLIGATDGPISSDDIETTSGGIDFMFAVGGGISADVWSAGGIGGVFTTGDLTGGIWATDFLGSVTVQGNMMNSNITVYNSYLGSVSVSGNIDNSHIRLASGEAQDDLSGHLDSVYAGGNMHNSTIEARSLGSVFVEGTITEDGTDGDTDVIRALEGSFFAQDSTGMGGVVFEGQDQWFDEGEPDGQRAFIDDLDD